jgi:uncharacterized protein (UPF0335 family)
MKITIDTDKKQVIADGLRIIDFYQIMEFISIIDRHNEDKYTIGEKPKETTPYIESNGYITNLCGNPVGQIY